MRIRTEDESNAFWQQYDSDEFFILPYERAAVVFWRLSVALAVIHCVLTFGWTFVRALGYFLDCIYTSVVAGIKYPKRFGARFWLQLLFIFLLGGQGLFMVSVICLIGPCTILYYVPKVLLDGEFAWLTVDFWVVEFGFVLLTIAMIGKQQPSISSIETPPLPVRVGTAILLNTVYAAYFGSISLHRYAIMMMELSTQERSIRNSDRVEGALYFKQGGLSIILRAGFCAIISFGYLATIMWKKSCKSVKRPKMNVYSQTTMDDDDEDDDIELEALTTSTFYNTGSSSNAAGFNSDYDDRFRGARLQQFLSRSHYQVLDLPENATTRDISKAYRRLARRYHPDQNRDVDATPMFRRIQEASEVLRDPILRRQYDAERRWTGLYSFGRTPL